VAENLLELRHIHVRHGEQTALDIAHLQIAAGEVLSVLGPNGAGKTTLLQVMGLLRPPTNGEVYFRGEKAARGNTLEMRRRIATVFQEPLLLNATVGENAALGLRLRGLKPFEIETRLRPWLERLGIAGLAARSARTLSGGEAQRTSLARALVLEPELLLLDEPFAALDPVSREALLGDFYRIVKDTRITTVFVTHDRQEAFVLAERVGVMKQSRLLLIGPRDEVFHRPRSTAVAEIVGFENCFAGRVEAVDGDCCIFTSGAIRLRTPGRFPPGARLRAFIRAENISLVPGRCASKSANRLRGKIIDLTPGVARCRVTLDCGGTTLVGQFDRRESVGAALEPGVEVTAGIDAAAVHVIADEEPY
jgi:tungstate transport system ATP-binding protein